MQQHHPRAVAELAVADGGAILRGYGAGDIGLPRGYGRWIIDAGVRVHVLISFFCSKIIERFREIFQEEFRVVRTREEIESSRKELLTAIPLCRTRILCQREKHRSQKSTLRYHFFSERGRSRGGQKDTWIMASGSAALEVE